MAEPRESAPRAGAVPAVAYVVAFVAYVVLGLVVKSAVLNWLVGPLFLLVVLDIVPRAARRLSR